MVTTPPPALPDSVQAAQVRLRAAAQAIADTVTRHDRGLGPDLSSLDELRFAREALDDAMTQLVVLLRNGLEDRDAHGRRVVIVEPHRWADIAEMLGMTRQGATKKYGDAAEAATGRPVTRVERRRR